jgi:hypothetical protein
MVRKRNGILGPVTEPLRNGEVELYYKFEITGRRTGMRNYFTCLPT